MLKPLGDAERAVFDDVMRQINGGRQVVKNLYSGIRSFQSNLADGKPNDWNCRAGARYLYICENGLVHWCSQQRGIPGRSARGVHARRHPARVHGARSGARRSAPSAASTACRRWTTGGSPSSTASRAPASAKGPFREASCSFMATPVSFDITSGVDMQEVDNAVNQARKEIAQRYDFKGSRAAIDLNRTDNTITLTADDDFKMNAVWEILQGRLVRRGVPTKNLTPGEIERAANDTVRRVITLQQGIPTEAAKEIVKFLKDRKLKKVQAAIQADQVRVSSASKDDLQEAIRLLREHDFGVALQFGNYRG